MLVSEVFQNWAEPLAGVMRVTRFLGDTNMALLFATAASFALLLRHRPKTSKPLGTIMEEALAGGGLIILITASGGAFGGMLQQTGVGHSIEELAKTYRIGILPLAWAVTVLIRTAQGSATVAMFTAVGILGGTVSTTDLGFHPVYVALAIGCGSKPFPWMNDSGFWLVTRMSGMTIGETLKSFSVMQCVMATTGLIAVMVFSKVFPLV
jgi:GntP family gluconate:H+ symporter